MWRSFATLYGVVLAALLLSYLAISVPVNRYIVGLVQEEVEGTTSGIFYLLEQEFKGVGPSRYPKVIAELNKLFPYGVALLTDAEATRLPLSSAAKKALASGHVAFLQRPYQMMLKRLQPGGPILKLNWEVDPDRDNQLLATGPVRLIEKMLAPLPAAQWPAVIDSLQPHFDFPVRLLHESKLVLPDKLKAQINRGEIVTRRVGDNDEILYGRILGSEFVFKAGPMIQDIRINNFFFLLIPVVIVALGVLLWITALGRDVKKLNHTTRLLGQGALDARVKLGRRSALAETGDRFNTMARDIERLIEGSRELTNAVSHDLKTPLARMRFALEMLQQKVADPEVHRFTQSLEGDVEELENLVGELLANARYERQLALKLEPVDDLFSWVQGIVERLALQYPDLQIELVNSMVPGAIVMLDRRALARTLRNVVGNAMHYARKHLRIEVRIANGQAEILVEDDGPGIPEADRERVLKPFVRLESSREHRGHGLGLAIAARIMEQHRGGIEITRSTFGGTAVRLYWPATSNVQGTK